MKLFVCMAPFHVQSKDCINPIIMRSKLIKFAPSMEGSHADFHWLPSWLRRGHWPSPICIVMGVMAGCGHNQTKDTSQRCKKRNSRWLWTNLSQNVLKLDCNIFQVSSIFYNIFPWLFENFVKIPCIAGRGIVNNKIIFPGIILPLMLTYIVSRTISSYFVGGL